MAEFFTPTTSAFQFGACFKCGYKLKMKITTWNVNGLRSLKKSIDVVLNELSADVTCFQETKVSRSQLPETIALVDGYTSYFSYPRRQSGYSGVATYCKDSFVPEDAEEGLSHSLHCENDDYAANILHNLELFADDFAEFDSEGRVITTYHLIKYNDEIQRLAIINVYCPRVDPEKLERHLYKMQFCNLLELKMRELCRKGCSVVIVGDLNIALSIIDHCDPCDEQEFNSSETRKWLKAFISSTMKFCDGDTGVTDAFRYLHPDKKGAFTCWNTKTNARSTNYGTRIDYILLSSNLLSILQSCDILQDYHGSDHCPVTTTLRCDSIPYETVQLPSICTRLWPEFSGQQQKLQAFFQKTQSIADVVTKHKDSDTKPETKKPGFIGNKSVIKKNKQKSILTFFKAPAIVQNTVAFSNATQMSGYKERSISTTSEKSNPHLSVTNEMSEQLILTNGSNSNNEMSVIFSNDSNSKTEISEQVVLNNEKYDEISSSPQSNQATVWKSVLTGPPKPPLCTGHKKESVLRTVKKKGPNCGRQFFMCAQPAGHPSNPEANCNFFKWAFSPKGNMLKK